MYEVDDPIGMNILYVLSMSETIHTFLISFADMSQSLTGWQKSL